MLRWNTSCPAGGCQNEPGVRLSGSFHVNRASDYPVHFACEPGVRLPVHIMNQASDYPVHK